MSCMPEILDDVGNCVDAVLRRIGPRIVLALPLGIGKPNPARQRVLPARGA